MKNNELTLKQVEGFWNSNLCGEHFIKAKFPTQEFFEQYRTFRYRKTHHLLKYIDWSLAKNKDVLEIGPGIGADSTMWAKYAKSYTGIDLTEESVKATQIHLDLLGLKGKILKGNAESLSFEDNTFDIVYSHGVLHHTPDINKSFKEVYRVLKKDATLIVMLYSKNSFNYWIRIQFYFRIRLIIEIIRNKMGLSSSKLWTSHLNNYKKLGKKYLSWKIFPHHCTDGPECEIANIYYKRKIIKLLKVNGFTIIRTKKAHFPIGAKFTSLERFIAGFIGFHQFVWAKK